MPEPIVINKSNFSRAWAKALLHIKDHAGTNISPLMLSFTGFDSNGVPEEEASIRDALETALPRLGVNFSIEDMAYAIFPQIWWERSGGDRATFFQKFIDLYPRLVAMHRRNNGRGMYFGRLIGARVDKTAPLKRNQLDFIIEEYLRAAASGQGTRASKFQATCFNPNKDHISSPYLSFPCLQQISFLPDKSTGKLSMNAFYATQQLVNKGYANFLGLARLASFMANEMGLEMERVNVFVGKENLNPVNKNDPDLVPVIEAARGLFQEVADGS